MWRDSYARPRFFGLDARLFFLIVAGLLHIREWFFLTIVGVIIFLVFVEIWKKVTIEIWMKSIRAAIAGNYRPAWNGQEKRFAIDYGAAEDQL